MKKRLSETESEIMEYFWETKKEYEFTELLSYFNTNLGKDWKKQTLNTFLKRMLQKGYLIRRKIGKKALYIAKMSRQDYEKACARDILDNSYGGKITNFIAALTGNEKLSEEEEKELIQYIKNR